MDTATKLSITALSFSGVSLLISGLSYWRTHRRDLHVRKKDLFHHINQILDQCSEKHGAVKIAQHRCKKPSDVEFFKQQADILESLLESGGEIKKVVQNRSKSSNLKQLEELELMLLDIEGEMSEKSLALDKIIEFASTRDK